MIKLKEITENNWLDVLKLQIHDDQKAFVASPTGILARAYVFRNCRAVAYAVTVDDDIVGLLMIRDLDDYPACYDLQQLLIEKDQQGKGCGYQALQVLIDKLRLEKKYPRIDVCVDKHDTAAIGLYEKVGFVDTGYIDPNVPDSLNLMFDLGD